MIPGASGSEITKIPPMDEVLRRQRGRRARDNRDKKNPERERTARGASD